MPEVLNEVGPTRGATVAVPEPAHEDAAAARRHWTSYEWSRGGDEWSDGFGGTDAMWAGIIYPRLASVLPAGHLVELGCGHGRISRYLAGFGERVTLVDVTPRCVEACRQKFAHLPHVRAMLNDGRSLADVKRERGEADVVVSWSAMVSVERSTLAAYLHELRTLLKPGGIAFIHHSNTGSPTANVGGVDENQLGGRRKSQSIEGFREDCLAAGLRCLSQELVPFNGAGRYTDCFSWLMRDEVNAGIQTIVFKADDWHGELIRSTRLARMYRKPV